MLPFLKPKMVAGLIVEHRKKDGQGMSTEEPADSPDAPLMSAAEDLIKAVHAKDGKAVAAAMRAAFEMLEAEPDEEGSGEDYDSQNQKAAPFAKE